MDYDVLEARHIGGFVVWLRFRDGTEGEVDLSSELVGPVFAPLHDVVAFAAFTVHPEFHTLVWRSGADIAPELLYRRVRAAA